MTGKQSARLLLETGHSGDRGRECGIIDGGTGGGDEPSLGYGQTSEQVNFFTRSDHQSTSASKSNIPGNKVKYIPFIFPRLDIDSTFLYNSWLRAGVITLNYVVVLLLRQD